MAFLNYLLLVGMYQLGMLVAYYVVFAKRKQFHFNRFYLLASLLISFLWPLLPAFTLTESRPEGSFFSGGTLLLQQISATKVNFMASSAFQVGHLVIGVYLAGVLWQVVKVAQEVFGIFRLYRTCPKSKQDGFCIVTLPNEETAFSFFNLLFLPVYPEPEVGRLIRWHEEAHSRQFHSADLLLCAFCQMFAWFLPGSYLFQRELALQHEFLADRSVLQKDRNTVQYAHLLVEHIFQRPSWRLATHFSMLSFTQKRLIMMKTNTPAGLTALQKLAAVVATLALGLTLWACTDNRLVADENLKAQSKLTVANLDFTHGFEVQQTFDFTASTAQSFTINMEEAGNYQVAFATESGFLDGIELTLYSPNGTKLVSNLYQGKYYPGFQYKCREAGSFRVEVNVNPSFQGSFLLGYGFRQGK